MAEEKKLADEQVEKVSGGLNINIVLQDNSKKNGSNGSTGNSVSDGLLHETRWPTIEAEEKKLTDEQAEEVFGGDAAYSTTTPDPTVSTGIWDILKNAGSTADSSLVKPSQNDT